MSSLRETSRLQWAIWLLGNIFLTIANNLNLHQENNLDFLTS